MTPEPITIKASGEVAPGLISGVQHLFDEYGPLGTLEYVMVAWLNVCLSHEPMPPPAPIRRRITWADLREYPPKDWDGVHLINAGPWRRDDFALIDICAYLCVGPHRHAVIEVPSGHPLASAGEAVE
jgi:hypothetical protein